MSQVLEDNDIPDAHWANWGREVHCSPPKGMLAVAEIAGILSENCLSKYFLEQINLLESWKDSWPEFSHWNIGIL